MSDTSAGPSAPAPSLAPPRGRPSKPRRRAWPPRPVTPGVRLMPGLFFVAFLTGTVLLFAYGPWPWPVREGGWLYGFLAAAHLALALGYVSAAFGQPRGYGLRLAPRRFLPLSLVVNLLLFAPTTLARTGVLVPDVARGLANPGAAYLLSLEVRDQAAAFVVVEYLRMVLAPLLVVAVPVTIYYWAALRGWTRVLGVLTIAGTIAMFIAMGTNKAIADLILIAPGLVLASHFAGYRRLTWSRVSAALAVLAVAVLLFFAFFTAGQLTREGGTALYGFHSGAGIFADQDHPLVAWLPDQPRAGAIAMTSYVSHGYYGLYLALEEPFVPMFGVGSSLFLQRNAARLLDRPEIASLPYPMRTEYRGWSALGLWSTIYPWLASDLSFPGVLIFVFVLGRLFAQSWLDSLDGGNPFAVVAFSLLVLMLFYIPANNHLLQDGESLVGLIAVLALWRLTRARQEGPAA
jgi:hypothetical protein